MSFSNNARKVRNAEFSIKYRVGSLNSCISELSFRIYPSYRELRTKYLPWKEVEPTEAELLASLYALEAMRRQYLLQRKAFIQQRQAEKREGQRHPRRADLEAVGDVGIPPDSPTKEQTHAEIRGQS